MNFLVEKLVKFLELHFLFFLLKMRVDSYFFYHVHTIGYMYKVLNWVFWGREAKRSRLNLILFYKKTKNLQYENTDNKN